MSRFLYADCAEINRRYIQHRIAGAGYYGSYTRGKAVRAASFVYIRQNRTGSAPRNGAREYQRQYICRYAYFCGDRGKQARDEICRAGSRKHGYRHEQSDQRGHKLYAGGYALPRTGKKIVKIGFFRKCHQCADKKYDARNDE